MDFLLTKAEIFYLMYKKDMESQDKIMEGIEHEIGKTRKEITELQSQLENERIILKNKGEYEELATIIGQYRTKDELQKMINECDEVKRKIDSDTLVVAGKIELKKKQLSLLTSILMELRQEGETKSGDPAALGENLFQPLEQDEMEEIIQ